MHRVEITRRALRSMRRIPKDRTGKILAALEELRALEDPGSHHNVKAMKGDWVGFSRMRIGSYRAVFEINPDPKAEEEGKLLLISVVAIGSRGDVY
jgi:mRNA interferase RelE/StbE